MVQDFISRLIKLIKGRYVKQEFADNCAGIRLRNMIASCPRQCFLWIFNTFQEWNQIDKVWNSLVKTFEHDFIYRILRIRIPPSCTNLALLCCLNLKISWIEESVTSILIQSTMANVYVFCFETDSALNCFQFMSTRNCTKLPSLCITKKDDYSSFWQKGFWWDFSSSYIEKRFHTLQTGWCVAISWYLCGLKQFMKYGSMPCKKAAIF